MSLNLVNMPMVIPVVCVKPTTVIAAIVPTRQFSISYCLFSKNGRS
jgi:hypothetical protein